MGWTPIRLLPGDATSNTLFVECSMKGWLLPWDQHGGEPRKNRLERLAEVSLVIPIAPYTLKGGGMVASDPKSIKQRIRVIIVADARYHVREEDLAFARGEP